MTQAAGTPATDALAETVQRLWPDAADVRLVERGKGRRGPDRGGNDDDLVEFAVVPNARSARLLVPVGRRAGAAALARYSAALSVREVAQRVVVGAATAVMGPALLGDRIQVRAPGSDHLGAVVADLVGQPVQLSLGIGTAHANRKPVLGAFAGDGRALAFVKVGDTEVSARHVRREAESLAELGRHDWSGIVVPSLLGIVEWRGLVVLVMSALSASPWQGLDGRWPIPAAAMDELCEVFDLGSAELAATPLWARLDRGARALRDLDRRERLRAALDRVAAAAGSTEVPIGAWHGDFTPWNMARTGGRLQLWDWERFETGVPRGLDRFHYAVNTVTRERGFDVGSVLEGLRRGASGDAVRDPIVAAVYLAALAERYLSDAQEPGGDVISARADEVLDILFELSRHLGTTRLERGRS